jgi:uroporphyrinogen decarboxylase
MGRIKNTLHGNIDNTPPIWFMRQAGRYLEEYMAIRHQHEDFLSLCYNPEDASEVTLQPIRRFGFDAAIIFSDILVIPQFLNMDVKFVKGDGPILKNFETIEDILHLKTQKLPLMANKIYDAIKLTKRNLNDDTDLIGFAGAAWTLATYMIEGKSSKDFATTKLWSYKNEKIFKHLINILTDMIIAHLSAQIEAGCNVVQLFDSWAAFLSDDQFEKWVILPHKKIRDSLKQKHPEISFIGFPRGAGSHLLKYVLHVKPDGVGCDTGVSIEYMQEIQKYCCVQGRLDPFLLATNLEKTIEQTNFLLKNLAGKSYIFNLGHGILPQTPIEHVYKVVETVRQYKA